MQNGARFAIVDPYSSGALLAPELVKRGCACLAVQSSEEVPALFRSSYRPSDFLEVVRHDGVIENTARRLREQGVQHVVAGCELGVELADELCSRLGLPGNSVESTQARRNKFVMAERVRSAGLRTPAQACSTGLAELLQWARDRDRWPVIVKPVAGCGSDGVECCASSEELARAYQRDIGRRNMLGLINEAVLVQEFLDGTEYVVDTVSCGGVHRPAAFWKYHRPADRGGFVCYDAMELLTYRGPVQEKLLAYATAVLNALQISQGPAHCELMWVDEEPVLVEVGARLSAGNNATLSRDCAGTCALDLTIEAYLEPERFLESASYPLPELTKHAANCFLIPTRKGRLTALPRLGEIESLRSFHRMSIGAKVGEPLERVAGVVTLIHEDHAVLLDDLRHIRHIQHNGFYQLVVE